MESQPGRASISATTSAAPICRRGSGRGRRRTVGLAFIALFLVLMVLSVVVGVADFPRAVGLTLIFTGCVIGFFYPGGWRAAG
ncbi:MAG: hypothetical protein JJU42_04700 [Rhodobacteraceae bacterium]|nr:hypothetical protein [Paracoccaceae bacterium]